MFGFGKKKVVTVQYIEAGKKSAFSQAKVPVDDMPDGYEMDSVIQVNGQSWTIVAADPNLKEDFIKSGKVQVFVTKGAAGPAGPRPHAAPAAGKISGAPAAGGAAGDAVSIPEAPPEHLFALATINDEIGGVNGSLPSTDAFEVHEDDWRQMEFIAKSQTGKVRQEFAKIDAIYKQHRLDSGFKRIHVRTAIPTPLTGVSLFKDTLEKAFRVTDEFRGVTMSGYGGLVELSFALEAVEVGVLWGELDPAGHMACLNLTPAAGLMLDAALPAEIAKFCADNNLILVDWLGMKIYGGTQTR